MESLIPALETYREHFLGQKPFVHSASLEAPYLIAAVLRQEVPSELLDLAEFWFHYRVTKVPSVDFGDQATVIQLATRIKWMLECGQAFVWADVVSARFLIRDEDGALDVQLEAVNGGASF